jgi:hypothetical protein
MSPVLIHFLVYIEDMLLQKSPNKVTAIKPKTIPDNRGSTIFFN